VAILLAWLSWEGVVCNTGRHCRRNIPAGFVSRKELASNSTKGTTSSQPNSHFCFLALPRSDSIPLIQRFYASEKYLVKFSCTQNLLGTSKENEITTPMRLHQKNYSGYGLRFRDKFEYTIVDPKLNGG
jgi:hypothetical protein